MFVLYGGFLPAGSFWDPHDRRPGQTPQPRKTPQLHAAAQQLLPLAEWHVSRVEETKDTQNTWRTVRLAGSPAGGPSP